LLVESFVLMHFPFQIWLALPLAAAAEPLVLGTYNLENYGLANRRTEQGFEREYPKPEAEKDAVRQVIADLRADVLGLQEMGTEADLDELRRDLRSEGINYDYGATMEGEDRNRHLAILAKRPLRAVRRHAVLAFNYLGGRAEVKRGLLEAVVATPAGDLAIFVVHLKSHLTERKEDPEGAARRLAEAAAVRDCILQEFPDPSRGRYVVLGDCNDGSHSPTLQRLERRGARIVAVRLPAADSRGETWTEAWRRGDRYSELDHILVAPGLMAAVAGGAARIADGAAVGRASDHRPVRVCLELISR